jgi:energy-coupling factor transporter ATP-binding protein EcfA2
MSAIHVADLGFHYPPPLLDGDPVVALCGINLAVEPGEFIALMGAVGAGKTTLCLALNGAIPHVIDGELTGEVIVCGQDTRDTPMGQLAMQVGLVLENAEAQLFNATVADEIAFGLEGMGLVPEEIEQRIDAMLDLIDMAGFRRRSPRTLSGGEQKRVAVASVLAMQPRVLVLDEPTSGLDSRGRLNVLAAIDRLRRENRQMTVVMATQDAEAAARFATRVLVLQGGRIALSGSPTDVFAQIEQMDRWGLDVPQLTRLAYKLALPIALTPEQAVEAWGCALPACAARHPAHQPSARSPHPSHDPIIEIRDLSHDYPSSEQPAVHGISLDVQRGEWLAVIGVNGSGKTTLLKHLNGLLHPTSGSVRVAGQDTHTCQVGELAHTVSYLHQNPDHSIFCATVRDEVAYGPTQLGLRGAPLQDRVAGTLDLLDLTTYAQHPPAVLGYGLRRQVALASVLAMDAPVLALDEPATGLDRGMTTRLMDVISARHQQGTTVVMISHDLQLVAQYAQRIIVLHDGRLVAQGAPQEILSDVELFERAGLEPLPVTDLARRLGWTPPFPISVGDWVCHD